MKNTINLYRIIQLISKSVSSQDSKWFTSTFEVKLAEVLVLGGALGTQSSLQIWSKPFRYSNGTIKHNISSSSKMLSNFLIKYIGTHGFKQLRLLMVWIRKDNVFRMPKKKSTKIGFPMNRYAASRCLICCSIASKILPIWFPSNSWTKLQQ